MNQTGIRNYIKYATHRYLLRTFCDFGDCYKDYALHSDACDYLKVEEALGRLEIW